MARPLKDSLDYFPHDTDASNDEKIEALRALYGNDGYAFYFILLERIYHTPNFEIDISDEETIQILARKISITPEKFNQILATALKRDCFDRQSYDERRVLTSNGIKKRSSVVVKKREEMRDRYNKGKGIISDAETNQETQPETPQRKGKKSKDNNKDHHDDDNARAGEEDIAQNVPERTETVTAFEKEFGRPLSPLEIEQIREWETTHPPILVLEALKRAVLRGKHSFKYIGSILLEWHKNNLRTIQAIQTYDDDFQARRAAKNGQARAPDPRKGKKAFGRGSYTNDGEDDQGGAEDKKKALIRSLYI